MLCCGRICRKMYSKEILLLFVLWRSGFWMIRCKNIAAENNLSETAFAVKEGDGYRLRWFTPGEKLTFVAMLLWQQRM
ncbi:hypothetical protein GCM10020331_085390 [Ectobacillus funiculus]